MKKAAKKQSNPAKAKNERAGQASAALPPANDDRAARARQRVEASRKAALQRAVFQSAA
jgi:hypothetical protein